VCTAEDKGAQRAELNYKIIGENNNFYLLDIQLVTGRFHQIRSQLSAIGCPIKGDNKYGFDRSNKDRSIHLHAHSITFKHPISGEKVAYNAPLVSEDVVWTSLLESLV
jgi:23S rRNA pseudouridine1911/1915/1917 synthase